MNARLLVLILFATASTGLTIAAEAPSKNKAAPDQNGQEVFGSGKVHRLHITLSAKDYAAMDPPPNNPFGPPGGAPGVGGGPAPSSADAGAGNFGFEFSYVPADVEIEGRTMKHVGLRYKGSGTYMMSQRSAKRSFKIDFDRFDSQINFHGLTTVNLNCGVMDPTKLREALAYEVFRAAGVPVPRTAFAEVTLTVPGKFDKEFLGVYTVVEQVDKAFLKTHFKSAKGLLLKPEGIRGLPHFDGDKAALEKSYNPKTTGDDDDWQRLSELTRLINKADDAEFRKQIDSYLDVDLFTRFLAANTLLCSLDGFAGMGHNYYLYLSPETHKFVMFPWDLDLAFGGFFMFGSSDQQADLSINHPHLGENKLIDRLLAMPDVKKAHQEHVRRLAAELLSSGKLTQQAETLDAKLKELIAKDLHAAEARKETGGFGPGPGSPFGGAPGSLKSFLDKRLKSITVQLAGDSAGWEPAMGGPGGFGPGGGFGPLTQIAKPLFDALDSKKDGKLSEQEFAAGMQRFFSEWDADKNGSLDQKEIEAGLQKLSARPMPPR